MRRCEWTRMFLEQLCEFKQVELTPFVNGKKFWRTFMFACRRCLFTTEQTSRNKRSSNMHAACARHSWIDSSLFVFSCVEKGIEFCSDSRRVFGF